ncbi:nitroreductase family deazaflavin-dependent oxidoreductase [Gordonia sp. X0973]|uniref:nitroreductase family deazaflavin-dependent oxidoreductase n=1 Tax=Gordonia sp. X0973 TaxID=2742602 RepID=UPI000F52AE19|nr:nitroreductase family deazaflavin-dependent oxidoreductase [Gordonia sp. X0973]QKT08261.1 nitroreductase family deazaflavin-dependent oxidoreductase [Gordonia sp. X0973]
MNETTRYATPSRFDRAMNNTVRWITDKGVSLAGTRVLTVTGRTSGKPHRLPVNPLRLDGRDYLVSVRGETDWVRNVRASGTATLSRGRHSASVTLRELPVADRAPILAAYLKKWGWEVARLLPEGVDVDADVAELAAHAGKIPVFVVS